MSATLLGAIAASLFFALAALAVACTDDPPARLPENVTAAIVYNELAERWHAGAMVTGDHTGSLLRVLCLTEAGKPGEDHGHLHTGINIDAKTGETEGQWGFDWSWRIDGQDWDGGRWSLSTTTKPATLVTRDPDIEVALLRELRRASAAEVVGKKDGEERLSVRFDLGNLFSTPVQFAIDDCNEDVIEERAGDYHSAYAYWLPDFERHRISLIEPDADGAGRLVLSCAPKAFTDDDAPHWIRNANGDIFAAATLILPWDDSNHSHDQADASTAESTTVSWVADNGGAGSAAWNVNHGWLQPPSARENLRFIDALRGSEELIVTVEVSDAEPIEMKLRGAALFARPMGAELDTCIREYADLNG